MTAFEIAITVAIMLVLIGSVLGEVAWRAFIRSTTPVMSYRTIIVDANNDDH